MRARSRLAPPGSKFLQSIEESGGERLVIAVDGRRNPADSGLPGPEVVVKSNSEAPGIPVKI